MIRWLDDQAAREAAAGKTAEEFGSIAREKARMAGLWLIGATIVWYIGGWKWALIPIALAAFATVQRIIATLIAARLQQREAPRANDPQDDKIS